VLAWLQKLPLPPPLETLAVGVGVGAAVGVGVCVVAVVVLPQAVARPPATRSTSAEGMTLRPERLYARPAVVVFLNTSVPPPVCRLDVRRLLLL
jgi:hypothetical protein